MALTYSATALRNMEEGFIRDFSDFHEANEVDPLSFEIIF